VIGARENRLKERTIKMNYQISQQQARNAPMRRREIKAIKAREL
jgi:hypothetical protein